MPPSSLFPANRRQTPSVAGMRLHLRHCQCSWFKKSFECPTWVRNVDGRILSDSDLTSAILVPTTGTDLETNSSGTYRIPHSPAVYAPKVDSQAIKALKHHDSHESRGFNRSHGQSRLSVSQATYCCPALASLGHPLLDTLWRGSAKCCCTNSFRIHAISPFPLVTHLLFQKSFHSCSSNTAATFP
ncbi:uncharacterized protein BKA78DRAFT_146115 [Phyllosticta capitalensis]|uniref:uncharacterized protein n=1 Tax=Phyllosticta capitalensis TaxID=121624 RepID=UPI00312FCA1A